MLHHLLLSHSSVRMKMFLCLCWLFIAILHNTESLLTENFNGCLKYFYKDQPPKGFQSLAKPHNFNPDDLPDGIHEEDLTSPAYICQMLGNQSYFATLYDRGRRIPLYSAYILDKRPNIKPQGNRPGVFKLEPQLIRKQFTGNMLYCHEVKNAMGEYNRKNGINTRLEKNQNYYLLKKSQAKDEDYKSLNYTRGHLNPYVHHIGKSAEATYTLTNVAPMITKFNNDIWNKYETEMLSLTNDCTTMYVVTGIVPGNNLLNSCVNIPSHVWNAYCCVNNNGQPLKSGAALVENENTVSVKKNSLSDLQNKLKILLEVNNLIEIFKDNCVPKDATQSKYRQNYIS